VSWVKASDSDLDRYRLALSQKLRAIQLPTASLLCTDMCCKDASHHCAVGLFAEANTCACLSAAETPLPHTSNRHTVPKRIPGWSDRVEPLRQKTLFWHGMWVDCGRPRNGIVADCMRRTRAKYHYGVRQVKRNEDSIVRDNIANALIDDRNRNFWAEVKKMRSNNAFTSRIVYCCTDATSIAQLFALEYRTLYSSVSFDAAEMHNFLTELDNMQLVDFICIKVTAGVVSQLTISCMLVPIWHVLLLFCSLA